MTVTEAERMETPRRFFHLRDVQWRELDDGQTLSFEGYAAVYNSWSEVLWTPRGEFIERFLPGSFDAVLATEPDVRVLMNHDKNRVLARTASGTATLEATDRGLHVWARMARTSYAEDLRLLMERGDVDGMSLAFEIDRQARPPGRESWYKNEDGFLCHDVEQVSGLRDVSIVTFPAYAEPEALLREIERASWADGLRSVPDDKGRSGNGHDGQRRAYRRCVEAASVPWAIRPNVLALITAILGERLSGNRPSDEEIQRRIGVKKRSSDMWVNVRDDGQTSGEIAVIPLVGPIYSRAGAMQQTSGTKSLDVFREEFRSAQKDPAIDGIVLDIESPGGTSFGISEMAAEIRASRKPVVAVANGMAASAAYWLFTAAHESVVTPSGEVGSVGVYMLHQDLSGMMEQKGVDTTLIHAGEYKVEGNPFEPLSEEAKAQYQQEVNDVYDMFVSDVARFRGVTKSQVAGDFGQGRMLMARDAVAAGMADRVGTLEDAIASLQQRIQERGAIPGPTGVTGPPGFFAGPIPSHSTAVVDRPWDGPGAVAKCRASQAPLRALHAWVDSSGDPNAKGSYKFPHHEVADGGTPGPANVNGCRNGLSRLTQANIPAGDKAGVRAHLQRHIDDFNRRQGNAPSGGASFTDVSLSWSAESFTGSAQVEPTSAQLREYLGLRADPAASLEADPLASEPADPVPSPLDVLKQRSKEAMQRAREDKVRITKEMLT